MDDLGKMGHTIESDPNDIWESLNGRCHKHFGFGDDVKSSTRLEDLKWAEKSLPAYATWDNFHQFHFLVEIWIKKVSTALKKRHQSGLNNNLLSSQTSEIIKIEDDY